MIEIKCDFCGGLITTKQNKGKKKATDTIKLEENICNKCKKADLNKKWESDNSKIEEEWLKIEKEKRNFFKNLLKHQKKEWKNQKKKEYLGTFFVEEDK